MKPFAETCWPLLYRGPVSPVMPSVLRSFSEEECIEAWQAPWTHEIINQLINILKMADIILTESPLDTPRQTSALGATGFWDSNKTFFMKINYWRWV